MEKLTKYRQLVEESREWHSKYKIMVLPLVIGALGGGIRQMMVNMGKISENKECFETSNLLNAENSFDGQWDYLEKGSLRSCSRDG